MTVLKTKIHSVRLKGTNSSTCLVKVNNFCPWLYVVKKWVQNLFLFLHIQLSAFCLQFFKKNRFTIFQQSYISFCQHQVLKNYVHFGPNFLWKISNGKPCRRRALCHSLKLVHQNLRLTTQLAEVTIFSKIFLVVSSWYFRDIQINGKDNLTPNFDIFFMKVEESLQQTM